jgi:hypothetical protein
MTPHPDDSEWMPFLYGECEPARQSLLEAHRCECEVCSQKVTAWQSTMTSLDSWQVDQPRPVMPAASGHSQSIRTDRSWLLIAAACLLAFSGAFLAGRSFASKNEVDVAALTSEVKAQLRMELSASLRSELSSIVQTEIGKVRPDRIELLPLIESESDRIVTATLAKWEQNDSTERQKLQQVLSSILGNQVALRTDLENLAIEAEAQIIRTRRELVRLSMPPQVSQDVKTGPMLPVELEGSSF